jgi:hypothetical protein
MAGKEAGAIGLVEELGGEGGDFELGAAYVGDELVFVERGSEEL